MSQTFKKIVGKDILFDFLEKICDKNDKFYTFDINAYKRAELLDIITEFTETIQPYYHKAKTFYAERKCTYSSLCTIIRQICKLHSIILTSKIVYSKSKYNIPYFIYF
tara:strand:- start:167 stop:490 length:324 start_codon:yes stop_codon:yes gene_type:complete